MFQDYVDKLKGEVGGIRRIQICIATHGWKRLRSVVLFRRAFKETDLHYHNHLSCHRPQRSMERFTNTELGDMPLIYGLTDGNARVA
ncbi:hypothetical protein TNCV_2339521 [Trichonephila clavipes]|nr:hypothetical protein TNCV_2339521 [Trichonephila clavipes]